MTRSRSPIVLCLLGLLLLCGTSCGRIRQEPFALASGERLVFFGDSITQAGLYVTYVEAYLLTRFPDRRFTLHNHGLNNETIAVNTVGPHPRPPSALRRFARDVGSWKPSRVVACFGMNDGGYRPLDVERFHAYRDAIGTLIERTRHEARAALVLLTPPPYDPYRRVAGDPQAKEFGYGYPAIDYDQTLAKYTEYLAGCGAADVAIADAHTAMTGHLERRRVGDVSFALSGDGVHPGPTGHWLLAQTLLEAWHAPALVAETRIDAAALKTLSGDARNLERKGDHFRFTWRTRLPMPIDPRWDRSSLALERVSERLNAYRLAISGLPASRYRLLARFSDDPADVVVGDFGRRELAGGLDLTGLARFPTVALAQHVLELLVAHRQAEDDDWRERVASPGDSQLALREPAEEDSVRANIRALCQPREMRITLTPIRGQ